MKPFKLLLAVLAIGGFFSMKADTPSPPPIPIGDKQPGKGKRDVSSPVPQCYISEGVLSVVSPDDWSFATVTITETTTGAQSVRCGFLDEGIDVQIPHQRDSSPSASLPSQATSSKGNFAYNLSSSIIKSPIQRKYFRFHLHDN